ITSVVHSSMPIGGRQCVNGAGFGPWEGNSTFTLNGTVLNTAVSWSDMQFCFQVPRATSPGTGTVQITTDNGASNGVAFAMTPAPVINDITPLRGVVGTQVTLSGTNFGATQDGNYVELGGTVQVVSWSDTQIAFTVPQGANPGSNSVWLHVDSVLAGIDFTVDTTPMLQLSVSDTPLQVDLTSPQTLDWIHWGRIDANTPDRKAGFMPL